MKQKIKNFVSNCETCKLNKYKRNENEYMTITDTPTTSFDVIEMDIVGPLLPSYEGHRYILTIQDQLTKYITLIPTQDKSAKTIARAFVKNYVLVFGSVNKIKTDMGTEFMNSLFSEIMKLLEIEHAHSTPYHPQTIGSLERNHRNLNEFLRIYVNDSMDDWVDYVKFYEFCYNTTPCVATGYTPFELVFGKRVKLPFEIFENGVEPIYNVDNYCNELKYKLQLSHERANNLLNKTKLKRKQEFDSNIKINDLKIGDMVYMKAQNTNKLEVLRSGPYEVVRVEPPNITLKIDDTKTKTVHRQLLLKL